MGWDSGWSCFRTRIYLCRIKPKSSARSCLRRVKRERRSKVRRLFEALPEGAQKEARALLEEHGCWEPLWRIAEPDSRYDRDQVPFRGRKVHYHNTRK